ncbi:flagellar regulator YcgR [Bordetella bronchiseptica MBORD675]|uniref:flagellar brake protein n=1 Tax=Bordetella bronchiseptica TaxID=518 RepID=UPI00029011D5|nr:flagellar brake protein [Bordetella bronchiseptica]KCV55910.1 flagellar regulator YcgR [Bordetella bronchiseptica 7E71]KDC16393.1 flagellar regulator YcgR [Bordetella bronchiseptica F-1]KDC29522.1 flagellar regulator YcgR [Bordetella bronchiseptica F2]KDD00108.1 flagellar regulator YcgR [Bordetella bronchiseptica MBORD675]QIY02293.1 flagellar brake protein [Bordetella bronchiseptica]
MPDAHDPYLVSGRFEIANLLQTLQARQCLLLMRIPGRPFNSVTSVLHVDAQAGQVVLDAAQDDTLNQRLADAGNVAFDTSLDNISISFAAARVTRCEFEARPALLVDLPETLTRVQRRDTFRIAVPVAQPATWVREAGGAEPLALCDISPGGLALADPLQTLDPAPGKIYRGVLALPELGAFAAAIRVVHHLDEVLAKGKTSRRIGCAFVELDKGTGIRIQAYVNALQRDQIARQRGL